MGLYAIVAIPLLIYSMASCLVGIGFVLVPPQVWLLRRIARAERMRTARELGTVAEPSPHTSFRWLPSLIVDRAVWREVRWAILMLFGGTAIGALGVALSVLPVLCFAAIWLWWLFPPDDPIRIIANVPITGWLSASTVGVLQMAMTAALAVVCVPLLARAGSRLAAWSMRESAKRQLAQQVDSLRRTRTGAVDAHTADLRRIERDLHDGTQAHLVNLALRLGLAVRVLQRDPQSVAPLLEEARVGAEAAMSDLRTVLRTTYPPILADCGLDGALSAVAARCTVPTRLYLEIDTALPASLEAAVYFVVTEALTNTARHSEATAAQVRVRTDQAHLTVEVHDNGRGGIDESKGTGIAGIRRRLAAFDAELTVDSPSGGPTVLRAVCPCA